MTFLLISALSWAVSCKNKDCSRIAKEKAVCFNEFERKILSDSLTNINFPKEINCFRWDSLEIGIRSSYLDYPCMDFRLIDGDPENSVWVKGKDLEEHMDQFDRDRYWYMIYFYNNGELLNQSMAIKESIISFDSISTRVRTLPKEKANFTVTPSVLSGNSKNPGLTKHRQVILAENKKK